MTTIAGKTVLLTGASRGIGSFIARALAKEQATIIGVARSAQKLEQIGTEIVAAGGQWIGIPFDISQIETLPVLVDKIHHLTGSVDILINNAGIEIYRAFQDYSTADLQAVISTNLLAAMELSRLVLPAMLRQGSGHIVNIASLAAKKGHPYDSIYSASKAGLLMWSDAIRQELRGTGVKVSVVCPGYVSDQGLMADTGIPAPKLAGTSSAETVAIAVVRVIQHDRAEVIVNQDVLTVGLTQGLFALSHFFPRFGDAVYRWMGVNETNQWRVNQKFKMVNRRSK